MAIAGALHPMSSGPKPPVQIILTSGSSWTVPADWNNANNKIECIGSAINGIFSAGIGGGAYARKHNLTLTPGASVAYQVGTPSSTASVVDTWFVSTSTVKAAGTITVSGGQASSCVGDVAYSGGNGSSIFTYNGGGGAAGPHGNGLNSLSNGTGGAGDNGYGGAGGTLPGGSNSAGRAGTEWGAAGSGGGGAGVFGGVGGNYGAGGGGGSANASAPGVIVITYTPA